MAKQRKLGRPTDQRVAMLRNMTTSLFKEERITTTLSKAKELKKIADKMVTLGKKGDLHSRRQALSYVYEKDIVAKLFEEIAPRYTERNGGYTRIMKLGQRRGDGAETAIIELV